MAQVLLYEAAVEALSPKKDDTSARPLRRPRKLRAEAWAELKRKAKG